MKRYILSAILLVVALTLNAQDNSHRYGIKSGIIHEYSKLNEHITPDVRYFDDYGDSEAIVQTIDMGALGSYENTTVTKKEKAWMYNEAGKPKSFDNPIPDLTFINPSQDVIEKYKLVDTGEEEVILGRTCHKFTYETLMGRRNKVIYNTVWVYQGIVLKSIMKNGRQETYYEVTDFQENVEIPAEVFVVPE